MNQILRDEINWIELELKKDNAKKIKNELDNAQAKVEDFRKTKSREALNKKYFQKKNVTPETLVVWNNEEVYFVETHCFCVPKHLAHHFNDTKSLEKTAER